ncbi:MAG: hypothetical protein ACXAE3_12875 [Candidatus Kariarchaeaceae archaeon]|jgi:hypothetical protein
MVGDSAKELWGTIRGRNSVMELAESLAPEFKARNNARYISVQNIDYEYIATPEYIELDIKIDFLSDEGAFTQYVIAKEFSSPELMEQEVQQYNTIEKRCLYFRNIRPAVMLRLEKNLKRIIYEVKGSQTIRDLDLSPIVKENLLGRLAAILQGEGEHSIPSGSYREIIAFIVQFLPFNEDERDTIWLLLEPHLLLLPHSKGGYKPATVFDVNNFMITLDKPATDLTLEELENNLSYTVEIKISPPQEDIVDRMADVASLYARQAYKEFLETGDVIATKTLVKQYFQGYNIVSSQVGIGKMEELYRNGITLDLQMLIGFFLLEIAVMQQTNDVSHFKNPDKLRFINFLLLKKPFLLIS